MSTLRTQMTHDMIVRGFTKGTQKAYLRAVTALAQFAHRRPDQLSDRDVQRYLVYLLEERHLAWSTCNTIVHGLRFFYHVTLGHPKTTFHIPCAKQPSKLPVDSQPGRGHTALGCCPYRAGPDLSADDLQCGPPRQ